MFTEQLFLHDIYDLDVDNAREGQCCKRMVFYEFPQDKCFGKQCLLEMKKKRLFPPTVDQMDRDPIYAKSCIHIYIYQQVSWRICHRHKDIIMKLKSTLAFGVLRTVPGIDSNELMSNIRLKSRKIHPTCNK